MMSEKELGSEEMDTLRRSRTPTVVPTANGEVHSNEKAQVYVHDLNLFVTGQLLEETPAVVSPRKLCEDDGYSYEWVSGQKPQEYYLQDGQLRTSCRSRVIRQFWKRFVFYIAITGLVEKRGGNSFWKK